MPKFSQSVTSFALIALLASPITGNPAKRSKIKPETEEITGQGPAILWRYPHDIASRNLFYGCGGKGHEPHGSFAFEKEDLKGSNPKFDVVDQEGVKWKVKLGVEARPETVASRLLWAVGYFTNEDYFMPVLRVKEMPSRLHRGRKLITRDGIAYDVRMKRVLPDEKKIGIWEWEHNPFTGTPELNGLRVLMAVINNWDLKDDNNALYQVRSPQVPAQLYMITDLGASFGTVGLSWTPDGSKGNLAAYEHSKFIKDETGEYVDFKVPARPALDHFPQISELRRRLALRWIGRRIPRTDARRMGDLLGRLSASQIRDAFRAGGYSPEQVERFSRTLEGRIAELRSL